MGELIDFCFGDGDKKFIVVIGAVCPNNKNGSKKNRFPKKL